MEKINETVTVASNESQDQFEGFEYAKKSFEANPSEAVIYLHILETEKIKNIPDHTIDHFMGLTVDQALEVIAKLSLAVKEIKGL